MQATSELQRALADAMPGVLARHLTLTRRRSFSLSQERWAHAALTESFIASMRTKRSICFAHFTRPQCAFTTTKSTTWHAVCSRPACSLVCRRRPILSDVFTNSASQPPPTERLPCASTKRRTSRATATQDSTTSRVCLEFQNKY